MYKSDDKMVRFYAVILSICVFSLILASGNAWSKPAKAHSYPRVTILAVPSLILPLTEVASQYTKSRAVAVNIDFDSAAELIFKVEDGDPADIFISDHASWTAQLQEQGLVDSFTNVPVAKNSLTIVANSSFKEDITVPDLAKRIALVSSNKEESSLGIYFEEFLKNQDLYDAAGKYIIKVADSDEVLKYIIEGKKAGAIYSTDKAVYKDKMHTLNYTPAVEVNYNASVVVSENMEAARKFLEFLQSNEVKLIFSKYGFKT